MAEHKTSDNQNQSSADRYKYADYPQKGGKRATQPARNRTTPAQNRKNGQPKKKKGKTGLVVVMILILVIAVGCVIGFLIVRSREQLNIEPTSPTEGITEDTTASAGHVVEKEDMPPLSSDDGSEGYADGAVYIWNNKGFELFKGNVKTAVSYAKSISNYKTFLGEEIKVYNMVVPSNTEFGLPERLGKDISNNQRENTEVIITNLEADVIPIDVYNVLGQHRNDPIFYHTDKLWTNKGAYLAYTAFAGVLGIEAKEESTFKPSTVSHKFIGEYIGATVSPETKNGNPKLLKNLDSVVYYPLPKTCTVTALKTGAIAEEKISFYNANTLKDSAPGAIFNTADCAYAKIQNSAIKDGSKIAIVKDAYGDALAPLLVQHYGEVHLIDLTNFKRNLKTYCAENDITEVLFVNGIMSANSAVQTAKMDALFD